MTWFILGLALIAVIGVIFLLSRELPRWQEGDNAFALLVPLRLASGVLLSVLILLVAIGWAFLLPRNGASGQSSTLILTYWLFTGLLALALVGLTMLDMILVRRGYQRHQEKALRDAFMGNRQRLDGGAETEPERSTDCDGQCP